MEPTSAWLKREIKELEDRERAAAFCFAKSEQEFIRAAKAFSVANNELEAIRVCKKEWQTQLRWAKDKTVSIGREA